VSHYRESLRRIVRLSVDPVLLAGTHVEGEARPSRSELGGFYRRMERGFGYFLTREDLAQPYVHRLADAFRMMPAVDVECSTGSGLDATIGMSDTCRVFNRRDVRGCPLRYFVDGAPFEPEALGINTLSPEEIEGIEVYVGMGTIPARFGGSRSGCGVIVIWTRR
jgi:outer membrane receptor for ferrienterochelin and colicin